MKADNLVELTNSLVCYGVSVCLFVAMNLYKKVSLEEHVSYTDLSALRSRAENGWSYFISWTSTCILVPVFSHAIFAEVYALEGGVADSTITIITTTWLFMLAAILWIYIQYIACFTGRLIIGVFFAAYSILYIFMVFIVFSSLHTMQPVHYVALLFIIPLVSSIVATRHANTFRLQQSQKSLPPALRAAGGVVPSM